jgi:hypothetical protein
MGNLKYFIPLSLLDDKHAGTPYDFFLSITVHFEFLEILHTIFGINRKLLNVS